MRGVRREEILDLPAYEASRGEIRGAILDAKRRRRVTAGGAPQFIEGFGAATPTITATTAGAKGTMILYVGP